MGIATVSHAAARAEKRTGTQVTLTAIAGANSAFTSWSAV
jgi:hypothetical protein